MADQRCHVAQEDSSTLEVEHVDLDEGLSSLLGGTWLAGEDRNLAVPGALAFTNQMTNLKVNH